jgi:hypothetical protein
MTIPDITLNPGHWARGPGAWAAPGQKARESKGADSTMSQPDRASTTDWVLLCPHRDVMSCHNDRAPTKADA